MSVCFYSVPSQTDRNVPALLEHVILHKLKRNTIIDTGRLLRNGYGIEQVRA
jgi:hypothetical protein